MLILRREMLPCPNRRLRHALVCLQRHSRKAQALISSKLLIVAIALAASAGMARSDELAQLKSELEALNADVTRIEGATPHLAFGDPGIQAFIPAGSAPPAASIKWQGYVRTIVGNSSAREGYDGDQNEDGTTSKFHSTHSGISLRAQIEAIAKSRTSAGEIGVSLKLRSDFSPYSKTNGALPADVRLKEGLGWWSPDKHWTLAGGYTRSLGNMDYGLDNDGPCTCYYTNRGTASDLRQNDTTQLRLTRSDGPLSTAVSFQSAVPQDKFGNPFSAQSQQFAFASSTQWNGKGFDAGFTTYFAPLRQAYFEAKSEYQIGFGFDADLTKFANISIGTALGRENIVTDCLGGDFEPTRYYAVSGLLTVKLSDAVRVEAGYARKYYKQSCHSYRPAEDASGGLYYQPVRNLTLGVEAEWIPFNGGPTDLFIPGPSHDETRIAFVSKFRF